MLDRPHRRRNALTGEEVLVSPRRTGRPWQGSVEPVVEERRPSHDPSCYLCPGNPRAGGQRNPDYAGTFAFDNDFAALSPEGDEAPVEDHPLLAARPERGRCRVVCFSPRHDLSLPGLTVEEIAGVVDTWADETRRLADEGLAHVQVFENRGAMMGCSNPHPHSQIWATRRCPTEHAKESERQREHLAAHGRPLLVDYLAEELRRGERVVLENDGFVVVVPFWAAWPFETLVLPRHPARTLCDLDGEERRLLADALRRLTVRYDRLFAASFPYSMGFHQASLDGEDHSEHVLHAHFYPPLLRSATVRKFMVGYELLAMPGRDLTPEAAAERLRALPDGPATTEDA